MTQYIRITNPLFTESDANGRPASGYLVWTLVAGTVDTLTDTYSDRDLTVKNANPIVLNVRGQADIFTPGDVRLVFTLPTGDLTSPIWTEDHVAEQDGNISDKGYAVWVGNNNYTVDVTPPYTSIPDGFLLAVIPDRTNTSTLVIQSGHTIPTVFTGTGLNDGMFSGAYTGSTPGAIFAVTIDSCYVSEPTSVMSGSLELPTSVTAPDVGNHQIGVTFVTAEGETLPGSIITRGGDASHVLHLSDIPIGPTGKGVTGRNIYMTTSGGSTFYLVYSITDNTTDVYDIDIKDATLVGNAEAPSVNTTGSGGGTDTFSWQVDSGAVHSANAITGIAQILETDIYIAFAETVGHIIGDVWALEVTTPVYINFCGLGNILVYKSVDGKLVVLGPADFIDDYPSILDYSLSQNCWILINPTLPVLTSLPRKINRREVTGDSTVLTNDAGNEISYIGLGGNTLTLLPCSQSAGSPFDLVNASNYDWTIQTDPTFTGDRIITPEYPAGVTSITLSPSGRTSCRLESNGVNYHLPFDATNRMLSVITTVYDTPGAFTWTRTPGYSVAEIDAVGAGGGGANSGGGGGAGGRATKVLDLTAVTTVSVRVGAGGAIGADGEHSTFGTDCVADAGKAGNMGGAGGAGGVGTAGDVLIPGQPGTDSGIGGSGTYGVGTVAAVGIGYGAGGGGTAPGYAGAGGLVIVKEYR